MSFLQYGDVILTDIQTIRQERTPVLSEDGMDFIAVKHTLEVVGYYHPEYISYGNFDYHIYGTNEFEHRGRAVDGKRPLITDKSIRDYLLKPHRELIYGEEKTRSASWSLHVLPRNPNGSRSRVIVPDDSSDKANVGTKTLYSAVDICGGPTPRGCWVEKMVSNKLWMVRFIVEACEDNTQRSTISSNHDQLQMMDFVTSTRHSCQVSMDEQARATYTINGQMTLRKDMIFVRENTRPEEQTVNAYFNPIPPEMRSNLPKYFRVLGTASVLSTDGSSMQWSTVIREEPFTITKSMADSGVKKLDASISFGTRLPMDEKSSSQMSTFSYRGIVQGDMHSRPSVLAAFAQDMGQRFLWVLRNGRILFPGGGGTSLGSSLATDQQSSFDTSSWTASVTVSGIFLKPFGVYLKGPNLVVGNKVFEDETEGLRTRMFDYAPGSIWGVQGIIDFNTQDHANLIYDVINQADSESRLSFEVFNPNAKAGVRSWGEKKSPASKAVYCLVSKDTSRNNSLSNVVVRFQFTDAILGTPINIRNDYITYQPI